jgi:hypothetical protein
MVPFKMKYGSGGFPFKSALKQDTQTSPCGDQTPCPDGQKFDENCNCVPIKKEELIEDLLKKGFTTTEMAEYDPSISRGTHKFNVP